MVEVVYYKRIADDPTKSAAERKEARICNTLNFSAPLSLAGPGEGDVHGHGEGRCIVHDV